MRRGAEESRGHPIVAPAAARLSMADVRHEARLVLAAVRAPASLLGPRYRCPICRRRVPFLDITPSDSRPRQRARCLSCGSLERHRLQYLVMEELLATRTPSSMAALHFAPEPFLRRRWERRFGTYVTADLDGRGVDHQADICRMPFGDATFDLVFASHVLEHVKDDTAAIADIARVLRPGGVAVLPVPIVAERTVEYPAANPAEHGHVRAPGPDYFDRYRQRFASVEVRTSGDYPDEHQLWTYEDRTGFPSAECPLRPGMEGHRHPDAVPICHRR
jgi:SAM-dependent methyltransferase